MRERTPDTLRATPAYRPVCYACHKPAIACICASIALVANRTGIIILQHPRERAHALGTARIARLGLARVRIEAIAPWLDASAIQARLPSRTALLYPTPGARDLASLAIDERPRHLLALDGTWFHAKKIYDAHSWLRHLPAVSFTAAAPSRYRLRRQPRARCLATIEAIVAALRIVEPQTRGLDGLLQCFASMVDRQAAYTAVEAQRPAVYGSARS